MQKSGEVASRMDLANWFVAPGHPLTARVAANRFWQQLFGVGLVRTSEDLGAQGEPPSHPELLDYLAVTFVESGWDVKALMREMVLSKAYRQASVASPGSFESDPENRLVARGSRYRMDAEMIRDQILASSGLLADTMFGRSVKPPQPPGLWAAVTMIGERFKPDSGEDIRRRSVYTYWKRAMPPPQMTILNAPIPRRLHRAPGAHQHPPRRRCCCSMRASTSRAARSLAAKALEPEGATPAQRLAFLYETVTSQLPDEAEQSKLLGLAADLQKTLHRQPRARRGTLCGRHPARRRGESRARRLDGAGEHALQPRCHQNPAVNVVEGTKRVNRTRISADDRRFSQISICLYLRTSADICEHLR